MSGHSKWSTIKRKKGANDAKRGKIFTKIAREIQIAARNGADPDVNFRLRLILDKARAANMPKDNVERAIKRGAGLDKEAAALEEITYEGYAPHGVALMIQSLTDNRNRTVAEVRHILTRAGGSMAERGSVAWRFEEKGIITVDMADMDQDELFMIALEAGAEDVEFNDSEAEITTAREDFQAVQEALEQAGVKIAESELAWLPKMPVALEPTAAAQVLRLLETLEDSDDITKVYSDLDITDEALQALEA